MLTQQQLQARVEYISREFFHLPFTDRAVYNNRLRRAAGRFLPATMSLDFSVKLFAGYTEAQRDDVIKHELTHYHLYRTHRGYKHGDADFKALLARVGGTRFAPAPPANDHEFYYVYQCQRCGQKYPRRRRFNTNRYVCSKCRGHLVGVAVVSAAQLQAEGLIG